MKYIRYWLKIGSGFARVLLCLIYFESTFYIIWPLRPYLPPICYSLATSRAIHDRALFTQTSVGGMSRRPNPRRARCTGGSHTKPVKIIGLGAMDVTEPYKSIGFGAMYVTKPYKFMGFGAIDGPTPYKFIWFGAIDVPKKGAEHFYIWFSGQTLGRIN